MNWFLISDFQAKRLWWLLLFLPLFLYVLSTINALEQGIVNHIADWAYLFGFVGIFSFIFGVRSFCKLFWKVFFVADFGLFLFDNVYLLMLTQRSVEDIDVFLWSTFFLISDFIYIAILWVYSFECNSIWQEEA